MKAVIDSFIPYAAEALAPYFEIESMRGDAMTAADVADADVLLVRTRTVCDASLLSGSRVRFLGTATIGYDHIDRDWCARNGIEFHSAAGCNSRAVLQWVSAVLKTLSCRDGWKPEERTIGIVGVGHVGSLIKEYASAWGFRVLCSDPPRERVEGLTAADGFVSLAELAAESDLVTLHTPLTRSGEDCTFHLAGAEMLGRMKNGAVLLNSSRGEVADNASLAAESGRLTMCMDTWEGEPGNLNRSLLSAAAVATPHIAGYSLQGKANASSMILRALGRSFGIAELSDWYPEGVKPSEPRPISWERMKAEIDLYCDLAAETARLKAHPEGFEHRRDTYPLRQEFF